MNDLWIEPLRGTIDRITKASQAIAGQRMVFLDDQAEKIRALLEQPGKLGLNFICTHNSRRSHLSQIWASVAATAFGLDRIVCYSGGTEATACNPRIVRSLRRAGFAIVNPDVDESNPRYQLQYADTVAPMVLFSKTFDDPFNGSDRFVAMMCCDHADQNCPVIHGSVGRVALHYRDPKASDGTPEESATYDERRDEIGAEMFYLLRAVAR